MKDEGGMRWRSLPFYARLVLPNHTIYAILGGSL
jgi:hypothetical protein